MEELTVDFIAEETGVRETNRIVGETKITEEDYRALIPKHAKRVLCAGRIVSSDQYANSAVRVQACCMAIGQVAGCATAICAMSDQHVANVEYPELCDKLKQIGCIVPAR